MKATKRRPIWAQAKANAMLVDPLEAARPREGVHAVGVGAGGQQAALEGAHGAGEALLLDGQARGLGVEHRQDAHRRHEARAPARALGQGLEVVVTPAAVGRLGLGQALQVVAGLLDHVLANVTGTSSQHNWLVISPAGVVLYQFETSEVAGQVWATKFVAK